MYPPEAKAAGVQGAVIFHATVTKDGTVASLQIVSGPPQLAKSAMEAVKQWTYKPYLLNGEPLDAQTPITVNYSLGDSATRQEHNLVTEDSGVR